MPGTSGSTSDLLIFKPDSEDTDRASTTESWRILVVDDDEQVHKVTSLALSDIRIMGRTLSFLHAYSAAEAESILRKEEDIAVILLDVVMERDDSGLELAKLIRTELKLETPRIILRTGQPGYAPELEVIQSYDINDYRMKSELTRTRLITALTTAVRSYQQVHTVKRGETGMRHIIQATNQLFNSHDHEEYSRIVLSQCASIAGLGNEYSALLIIEMKALGSSRHHGNYYISGASGEFRSLENNSLDELSDTGLQDFIRDSLVEKKSLYEQGRFSLYYESDEGRRGSIFFSCPGTLDELSRNLLEVFAVSVGIGFKNISLISQLNQYAYFDQLSRLPNRTRFLLELAHTMERKEAYTVAVLDIDNFSSINNALGHRNGDLLLQAIADRLANSLPADNLIARIGGDTFAILGPEELMVPESLLEPFKRPFVIKNTPLPVSATLGLSRLYPQQREAIEVLKEADMAMKMAKSNPSGQWLFYSDEMSGAIEGRLEITRNLHPALSRNEFILYYQPQVNLRSGRITGAEALIRWRRANGTLVPPGDFIPVAESTGLIIDIGRQVFRQAFRQAQEWKKSGLLNFHIAINVSVRQLQDLDFLSSLSSLLQEEQADPSDFELEITESTLMNDIELVIALLEELKNMGFSISVDDFGTGYSSLSYLLRLPIHRLKVDRSFIMNLEHDARARTLSEIIVRLANNLGLSTIAEGIESQGQLDFIRQLGCNEVQGYYYSEPLPAQEFETWCRNFTQKELPGENRKA